MFFHKLIQNRHYVISSHQRISLLIHVFILYTAVICQHHLVRVCTIIGVTVIIGFRKRKDDRCLPFRNSWCIQCKADRSILILHFYHQIINTHQNVIFVIQRLQNLFKFINGQRPVIVVICHICIPKRPFFVCNQALYGKMCEITSISSQCSL